MYLLIHSEYTVDHTLSPCGPLPPPCVGCICRVPEWMGTGIGFLSLGKEGGSRVVVPGGF